jgi:hypothetical protein
MAAMCEPAGFDPRVGDLSSPQSTLSPDVLARLAAMASQLATERVFLPFIPQQERVPV